MTEWVIKLLFAAGLGWCFWSILRPQYCFVIRIEAGRPTLRGGNVTPAFFSAVENTCRDCGITRGVISGVHRGRRVQLRFSRDIAPGTQQQIRNAWLAEG